MTAPICPTGIGPRTSVETGALMAALIKFRGMVGTMARNKGVEVAHKAEKGGGKHEFRYTDAGEQFETTLAPLEQCELAVSQPPDIDEWGKPVVWTLITHVRSQQWIAGRVPIIASSGGSQGYNAALSSARRVGFNAVLGLVSGDKEDSQGYDARKARAPRGRGKEQPPAEPFLHAIDTAGDVHAVKIAVLAGRGALAGWPSAAMVEAAAVAWFKKRIDGTSEQTTLDAISAALVDIKLGADCTELRTSFRAAAGRIPKPGQVPT